MQRCNPDGSSNEDRTSGSDEDQNDWDKELIHAVGMKIGKAEKDPEKVRLDRMNVCLDEGANINVQDCRNGDTVLHMAVKKDYPKIVKLVLQRGARTDIPNDKGDTAVRLAEILDKNEIERILKGPVEQRSELQVCRSSAAGEKIKERPGFVGSKTYPAGATLTRSWPGIVYQLEHLEFTLHCAFPKVSEFYLAAEIIGAGKLDDLVLQYKNREGIRVGRFVQLKYSINESNISPSQLLKDEGDFSVSNYFISWLEIKDHELFRDIEIRNVILCSTMGLDVKCLEKNQIYCDVAAEPDKSFELKSTTKETAWYRFSANKESNKKLYHELRECVFRKLVKLVTECVYKNKAMSLEVDSFRDYHLALTKYVFDANNDSKTYEFRRNFIENDNLSPRVERFRRRFLFEYREIAKLPEKLNSEESVWKDIKERFGKLAFRQEFGKSPKVPNPRSKSELPDDINDTEISNFLEEFTLAVNQPGVAELDAIISRKISNINQCSGLRADQIGSAFRTKILKWFCGKGKRGNDVEYLSHEVCKQFLDDMKHKVDSPNELVRKEVVKFQGYKTSFGKLLNIRDSYHLRADELEDFTNVVDSRTLFKIILGEEIRIGEGLKGLGEVKNYYVNRTIYQHVVIKKDIFYDEQMPDLLAISGIDRELTDNFVQMKDASPAIGRNSTKFTILKDGQEEEQFRALCVKNPRRNIHWLKEEAGKYIWKRSQGDVTYLFEYRDPWESEDTDEVPDAIHLSESDLAAHCKPIIISDTPGMGKSTLLTYLAKKIKEDEPDLLVLQIDLIKHTAALDKISRKKRSHDLGTINGAVQFLVNELLSHRENLAREVFKRIILQQRKVAIIVDGFDEIRPKYQGIVIDLLQALSNYGIKKLLVTTRLHTKGVLERKLRTFAYAIAPLSVVNQEDLLIKSWAWNLVHRDCEQKTEDRARRSAKAIINTLTDSIENYQNKLTATPLHTRMMADLFEEDVTQEFIVSNIERMELSTLFHAVRSLQVIHPAHLEARRLLICEHEYLESDDTSNIISTRKRGRWALCALFGKDKVKEWLPLQKDELEMSDIAQEGLVTRCVDDQQNGIMRSRTEMWAADFFTEMLIQGNSEEPGRKFFVTDILLRDDYENLRSYLDYNLHGKNVNALVGDQSWMFHVNEHRGGLNETVFHVAVAENNLSIIKLFLNCLGTNPHDQKTLVNAKDCLGKTAVHWAVEHRRLDPIRLIVEHTDFEIDSRDSEGATPLYIAASLGELNIVKYLLDRMANINSKTWYGRTPLDGAFLTSQWDVVKYLCMCGADLNELALETSVTEYCCAQTSSDTNFIA